MIRKFGQKNTEKVLTGAPGFPGTDTGGMLGLLPGGGGGTFGVGAGLGAAVVMVPGAVLGVGDFFKRFSASLGNRKQ